MQNAPATADDFRKWASDARTRTAAELDYIVRDCREAEVAMRGWNPEREGYYSDQAATYYEEVRRRAGKRK